VIVVMADSGRLVDFALSYASRGWAVLPCHSPTGGGCTCSATECSSPGKHPRLVNGLTGATTDSSDIEGWWRRWPNANVAIRTGEVSGLVVIDIDRRGGGDGTLAKLVKQHGRLPKTLAVQTGDGVHLYFQHPGCPVPNDASRRLGPGIDIRGDGGYVLAPPSLHHNGRRYRALDATVPAAAIPVWMQQLIVPVPVRRVDRSVDRVRDGTAWARAALDSEASVVRAGQVGERNALLNRSAFSLGQIVAGGELEREVVEGVLIESAVASGLTEREARLTVASGLRAGAQHPRTPPGREVPVVGEVSTARSTPVTFVPWPKDWDGPGFPARSDYVERCWTSLLGPTAVLALRSINQEMQAAGGPVELDLEDFGRSLGIGGGTGKNAIGSRSLARLEQFNVAISLPDGTMAIRTELPPLRDYQLRRAGPTVQRWHQQLCPEIPPIRSLSR
jgi:hypothetical protein